MQLNQPSRTFSSTPRNATCPPLEDGAVELGTLGKALLGKAGKSRALRLGPDRAIFRESNVA
jgi:hypothetical protein